MNTRGRVAVFQGVLTVATEVSLLIFLQLLILPPSWFRICGGGVIDQLALRIVSF